MTQQQSAPGFYDLSARRADGTDCAMAEFRGRVLLVVNTASRCGFTPQYEGLEQLHHTLAQRGFSVLAFPCNQFGAQEPGDDASIVQFCTTNFHATFPIFAKIDVNGPNAHPIFRLLRSARPGLLGWERIKWNFTKFLVDREGMVVQRFAPNTKPAALAPAVERLLGRKEAKKLS